jgi:hypothetical protein
MKSVSSLTDFYYNDLNHTLIKLEKERRDLKHRILFFAITSTAVFTIVVYTLRGYYEFIIFIYIAFMAILYKFMIKDYTHKFKMSVIKPLIHTIDETLFYSFSTYVPEYLFENSKLFDKADKYGGNDYVKGKIDGINIQFSDIYAQKKNQNSKGKDTWSTIFQGLFIVSDFNKNFSGETIVLPDTVQNTFGDLIGHWLQSNNASRDELVKMDDPEFEKEFVVYSSDQIEARYILSHSLMKKLLNVKRKSNHPIYISFVGTRIFMAISYDKDLFEPTLFSSLLDYNVAMEYIKTLHLAVGIIEDLKLNQKLWSKK